MLLNFLFQILSLNQVIIFLPILSIYNFHGFSISNSLVVEFHTSFPLLFVFLVWLCDVFMLNCVNSETT